MIKCVAIDDEPIALNLIQEYCKRFGDVDLQCFTSPIKGMECIRNTHPDIVFLDIELNSHNGVELAKGIATETCIIFTTAYSQYALDGFNVDAIDFLHKPVFYQRFEHAMHKALIMINAKGGMSKRRDAITLKVAHKTVVVDVDDISYVEAMDNYVKVYRFTLPTVISQITMKEMESQLPDDRFIRVHRSFIVSLRAIERFTHRQIFLKNSDKQIPVGRTYTEAFNNLYNIFKQNNNSK